MIECESASSMLKIAKLIQECNLRAQRVQSVIQVPVIKIQYPLPGIRNPWRGIQNPKVSWTPLHGAIVK